MLIAFLLLIFTLGTHASISGYIGPSEEYKLLETFARSFIKLQPGDVITPYYGAKGFKLLKKPVNNVLVKDTCAHLKREFKQDAAAEQAYHALGTWSLLSCTGTLHTNTTIKSLKSILESDKSTPADLRYAAETLLHVGETVPNPTKVAQLLQARLREDDSLSSLGHALHASIVLDAAGKFILDRVEDIVVQTDEIDGRMLQWEGGLTTTGLLLTGLLNLKDAKPITQVQADKFATYLLSRLSVQLPRGALALVQSVLALTSSGVSPVCITLIGTPRITSDKPELHVRISNLLGEPLKVPLTSVLAQSATRVTDDVVVLSKELFKVTKDPTEYVLELHLEPGQYKFMLSAGTHSSAITIRILGSVKLQFLEIGLGDADGSIAPTLNKLEYRSVLGEPLQADSTHNLIVKFQITRVVHQAFLRLYSKRREIIFIAEKDSSNVYKINVNLVSELTYGGEFYMELIVGDSVMSNPFVWGLGTINVKLPTSEPEKVNTVGPKPIINHLFRQPDKRPPQTVSMLFTILVAFPLLILIVSWFKIGINFDNFIFKAVPFHLSFGAILALFGYFWYQLDMFTTCKLLTVFGLFTFLSGYFLLSEMARRKQKK